MSPRNYRRLIKITFILTFVLYFIFYFSFPIKLSDDSVDSMGRERRWYEPVESYDSINTDGSVR